MVIDHLASDHMEFLGLIYISIIKFIYNVL